MSEDLKPTTQTEPDYNNVIYPERLSLQGPDYVPIEKAKEWDKNPEAYFEWEMEYKDTRRALNLDFKHQIQSLPIADLRRLAQPQIDLYNQTSQQPIDVSTADETLLQKMIQTPDWQIHLPKSGSEEETKKWQEFKNQWPEHMQANLDGLHEADSVLRSLANDDELRKEINETRTEKLYVIRAAVHYNNSKKKVDNLSEKIADIYMAASKSNRPLTKSEQKRIAQLQEHMAEIEKDKGRYFTSEEKRDDVIDVLHLIINREQRRDYERGVVLTKQMKDIIDDVLPSLVKGQPVLLVGETGGAKTALAEFISRSYFGTEPEMISGYGEVNTYQIMGKMALKDGQSVFEPGPLLRAMEEGRPIILDEINAMPAEILKRLNKILQLRPGDKLTVQEDGGREITIKNGFVIMATANEKSKRYKGVDDLSVEFQNRFGANIVRVRYPDHDVVFGQTPVENEIIARAALTDHRGNILPVLEEDELDRFAMACQISQQIFSGNFGEGYRSYLSPDNIRDSKPGLEETVLAPRTMVGILEKLRDSNGQSSLEQILRGFIDGIKNPSDKKVLLTILQGQGFLRTPEPTESPEANQN